MNVSDSKLDKTLFLKHLLAAYELQEANPGQRGITAVDNAFFVLLDAECRYSCDRKSELLNDEEQERFLLPEAALIVSRFCRVYASYRSELSEVGEPKLAELLLKQLLACRKASR